MISTKITWLTSSNFLSFHWLQIFIWFNKTLPKFSRFKWFKCPPAPLPCTPMLILDEANGNSCINSLHNYLPSKQAEHPSALWLWWIRQLQKRQRYRLDLQWTNLARKKLHLFSFKITQKLDYSKLDFRVQNIWFTQHSWYYYLEFNNKSSSKNS